MQEKILPLTRDNICKNETTMINKSLFGARHITYLLNAYEKTKCETAFVIERIPHTS
jgi:hypothetical protein